MPLDIESLLLDMGVEVIRESGDELVARCPGHLKRTGHEDSHPSWSINTRTYVHYCFSCGYSGTLHSLYVDRHGEFPPENLEWELTKQSVLSSVAPHHEEQRDPGPMITEWTLRQFSPVPDRLLEGRHLKRESVDHFGVRWDNVAKCWVLPIREVDGTLMGFQYRQKGTVINYPEGVEKSKTLFGVSLFLDGPLRVAIVESPLDAVRFWNIGVPAVSSFGAAVSDAQIEILTRNFRTVVVAMDNDPAGRTSAQYLQRAFQKRLCVSIPFKYSELAAKDPGDVLSDDMLRKAWNESVRLT